MSPTFTLDEGTRVTLGYVEGTQGIQRVQVDLVFYILYRLHVLNVRINYKLYNIYIYYLCALGSTKAPTGDMYSMYQIMSL
jgi:hypothetical protein